MKKNLLAFLIAVITINCYSQISFEKGHFIDNNNQKINCLIKNTDWMNNPTEFEYKLSENGDVKKTTINSVKEFEIYDASKYVRRTINIDRSTENFNLMTNNRSPVFDEEELFLKVLIEGAANLYFYREGNLKRYFYKRKDTDIEQLIYKSYRTYNDKLGKNTQFKQQLWNDLKCSNIDLEKLERIEYKKNSLIKFFIEYNTCNNSDFTNYEKNENKDLFNLTIRPRLNSSSLTINNKTTSNSNTDFGNKFGFGLGIEVELILPFNKNKWAILIEATYQSFEAEVLSTTIEYSSVEIPIGLRHYFFINENSKIFANASVVFDVSSNSNITMKRDDNGYVINKLDIATVSNLALGIGYKLNDTYSLEMRYQPNREVLDDYAFWYSDYSTFSMIFGYSFF